MVTHVCGQRVVAIVDEWRIIDRWWTEDEKIDREYAVAVLEDGRRVIVMRENDGLWTYVKEDE
jgi:hypothetical protein